MEEKDIQIGTIFAFDELHVELKVGKEGKSYYKQTKNSKEMAKPH